MFNGAFFAIYPGIVCALALPLSEADAVREQATQERAFVSTDQLVCVPEPRTRLALAWHSMCPARLFHFFARLADGVTGGLMMLASLGHCSF